MACEFEIGARERQRRMLPPTLLDEAVRAVHDVGFAVLHGAIDTAHVETLRERMLGDVERILALDDVPYQFEDGHLQQDPPPFPPYLFRDVLVNEFVVAITGRILGDGVRNAFYSGNTCLPGSTRQPLHVDSGQLWPGLDEAPPAYGLVVNVPVVDATADNGSTQLWPGTHLDTTRAIVDGDLKLSAEAEARLADRCAPLQPAVPAGGVLVRDIRLWHRGMPNRTSTPRPMIAMIHWPRWWRVDRPLRFPKGTEAIFADSPLTTVAEFVDPPIDYIGRNRKYDYRAQQAPGPGG